MMQLRRATTLACALALAVSACGGDDDDAAEAPASDSGSGGSELTVVAEDIAFPEDTYQADAGTYTIYCDVPGHRQGGMEATLEVS